MAADVKKLIGEMTLEEKASLLGGDDFWHTKAVERLGIPRFMVSDGPHGLRKQDEKADHLGINTSIKAVCFPAGSATASSFDRGLVEKLGETIGDECQAENLSVVLGPAVCIKRSPLCGRNFEYYSEDPYLAGEIAAAYVNGVQSRHVGTSIKHYAANNQEAYRMSISAEVSERAMREIYLPAFETAVKKAQPKTVMCSYNKINGVYSSENEWLLNKVLRDDWGFRGAVVTDWGAVDDRVEGVKAGLDLEMPGNTARNDQKIVEAVKNGTLDEKLVDKAVGHVLTVFFDYYDNRKSGVVFDRDKDHEKAAKIEEECAVLLQNRGALPIAKNAKTVYIGEFAEKPRYQGGGSSHINSSRVVSALEAAKASGRNVTYVKGFPADCDREDPEELAKAVEAAKDADAVVIFAGIPEIVESEGYDRDDMKMPACQNHLIDEVAKVNPNITVVLHNGSAVETPWADKVSAILELYLGGQGVGTACDRLLYGEANPSGHLAESFPYRLEDNPSYLNFPGDGKKVFYAEDVFVGYRYYDTKKIPVRWAFGHGLSYTTFAMGNLKLSSDSMREGGTVKVSVDVTNTGKMAGKEVVQLYVADRTGTPQRPAKELKGFGKVELAPGETKTVTMEIDTRSLSYWEERIGDWYAKSGVYGILVGDSSDHILAETELHYSTDRLLPMRIAGDTTIGELMEDPRTAAVIGKFLRQREAEKTDETDSGQLGAGSRRMSDAMAKYMPLKSMASFSMEGERFSDFVAALKSAVGQKD
ncbi:MAG: glycoside hydrolase family 3 C-terminal domain-containing protein [Lachnospiraceae bacterium]|jgi:beta-glucosidase